MTRLLLTANSPGEMAGWVRPLVRAWQEQNLGPVDLLLLPCTFATGQEERVARSLDGIERIYRPKDYFKLLLHQGRDYHDGVLLHLGGDLMYSALLSWRWGIKSWSYLWARPWWNSAFSGFFTKDEWGVRWLRKRRVPAAKIHRVGDLVLDAVRQNVAQPCQQHRHQISYLPGSRAVEVRSLVPCFLEVHARLRQHFPDLKGVLHVSPFLPQAELRALMESPPDPLFGGRQGRVVGKHLVAGDCHLEIATEDGYQRLSESRLAVSIPGTKTAEAGYLRTPIYTIIPLNRPEHLPSIGLIGLLDWLPGGANLKGRLMLRMKPKIGLLAHPNILAQRPLLPEILDIVNVEILTDALVEAWDRSGLLEQVSEELEKLYSWDSRPAQTMVRTMARALTASGRS